MSSGGTEAARVDSLYPLTRDLAATRPPRDLDLPGGSRYKPTVPDRSPQVSLVIPCYDEAQVLPRLLLALDEVVAKLEGEGRGTEVIVVDDGSQDGSFAVLKEAAGSRAWLRVVRFRRNFGQTAAMAAGFERARGRYVVPMDADLQNDPHDVPALLARLEEGYDVVSGWRRERKDRALTRRLPSKIANWLVGWVSGLPLHDFGCTLKAYRREILEPIRLYGEMHRFIPIAAQWNGARITELVVRHHPRREGRSKYGLERTLKVLLDLTTLKFLGDYSTKPLYLFGKWGAALIAAGVLSGAVTLAQKFANPANFAHRNPLLLLAVMLFVVGMQIIGMGLLAELLVRTYHEAQRKPVYAVAEELEGGGGPVPEAPPLRRGAG
jgi:glycosyltransferase involved in cell wall biosynthesis